jgi:hypothetical protein
MAVPAEKLEIPSDTVTYATADLEETIRIFLKHGLRFLSPEEIAAGIRVTLRRIIAILTVEDTRQLNGR